MSSFILFRDSNKAFIWNVIIVFFVEVAMGKLQGVYDSLEPVFEEKEICSAEDDIKRECQILWETLCDADPQENMFGTNSYKKFMVGCISKLGSK